MKMTVSNQLATGSVFTTLRNSFWNMAIFYTFLTRYHVKSSRALFLGDDLISINTGLPQKAAKKYTYVCTMARMEAKAERHRWFMECSFLSKSLFRDEAGNPYAIPIIGKALGRFNIRTDQNTAVPDDAYMFSKALGYAYEFRQVEELSSIFLDRAEKHAEGAVAFFSSTKLATEDVFSKSMHSSARGQGLLPSNILDKIACARTCDIYTFNFFCYFKYKIHCDDIIELVREIVDSTELCDVEGPLLDSVIPDFL